MRHALFYINYFNLMRYVFNYIHRTDRREQTAGENLNLSNREQEPASRVFYSSLDLSDS